jgi:serine/threonine protein kinase
MGGLQAGMLQPSESLDGYRVIRLIGSGGFGAVWLCQSEALGDYRALKFIPDIDPGRIQKEFDALCRYRTAAGQLRSPSIMPIEHVNRRSDGLYYIMPLADGYGSSDPLEASWCPLTLAAVIEGRRTESAWFTSEEIKGFITPILHALQLLSDAELVHRDVKPDNILFLNGTPCLGDISLLGEDSHNITRRGTPGYSAPSWFVESGGPPDMFGAATTLYSLLTGNPPDKMGRAAFRWPPQGEESLTPAEKREWQRIHNVIRRAVDERSAERFRTFDEVAQALNGRTDGPRGSAKNRRLLVVAGVVVLVLVAGLAVGLRKPFRDTPKPPVAAAPAAPNSDPSNPGGLNDKELADYRATASLAAIYFNEKNYQSALEMLGQLNTTYPVSNTFPYYSTLRAQCLHKLGRTEDAHAELRRGLLGKRLDLVSFNERMKLWDALGDLQGAETEVTRIIEEFSPITLHYTARARLRLRRGDFDGAEKDILSASTLDNDPGRAGLADKLRAGYAEEIPDYARYLAERGITTLTPPKPEEQPAPAPEATPHETPATTPQQTEAAPLQPEKALPKYRADLQRFDKAMKEARKTLIYPHELISGPVDTAIVALKKMLQDAPSHREVDRQLTELLKQMETSLKKVPPMPDVEAMTKGLAPLEALAKKMKSIPKTAEERINYDWDVRPLVDDQLQKLQEDLGAEAYFRSQQSQKIADATAPFLNKYASTTDADGSMDYSLPITKTTGEFLGACNKLSE